MSPEQAAGKPGAIDHRTDNLQLGRSLVPVTDWKLAPLRFDTTTIEQFIERRPEIAAVPSSRVAAQLGVYLSEGHASSTGATLWNRAGIR